MGGKFEKSREFYKWEFLRIKKEYQKDVIECRERHKEALHKFPPLLKNYPPEHGEDYNGWFRRICATQPVNIDEPLDSSFSRKWKIPFPMLHTIEYPHPNFLLWLCLSFSSCVTYLGNAIQTWDFNAYFVRSYAKEDDFYRSGNDIGRDLEKMQWQRDALVLQIDPTASYTDVVRRVKHYLSVWREQKTEKQKRSRSDLYDSYISVYVKKEQGLKAEKIAKDLWPREYRKWKEKLDRTLTEEEKRERQEIETLTAKYIREGKTEWEAWDLAEREVKKKIKKTNPLLWRVYKYYQKAKYFKDNPDLL